jgi:hypothetical protein
MNIPKVLGGVALAGALSFGGISVAMAADSGPSTPTTTPASTAPAKNAAQVATRCEKYTSHVDQINAKKTQLDAQLATLKQNLTAHPDRAARIQVRIDRVNTKLDRIVAVQAWATAHCSAPTPTPAG